MYIHVCIHVSVMHVAEASDRHGLGHSALGLRKTAQLDPERVFAQGWHSGVLEPPKPQQSVEVKSGIYGSGSMWHFLHVPQFMPNYMHVFKAILNNRDRLARLAPRGCGPAALRPPAA